MRHACYGQMSRDGHRPPQDLKGLAVDKWFHAKGIMKLVLMSKRFAAMLVPHQHLGLEDI